MKDWCHANNILQVNMGMSSCANHSLHTHNVIVDNTRSVSRSTIKIAITRSVFIAQHGNKYCHNLWLAWCLCNTLKFRFRFGLKDRQWSNIETAFGNLQYQCLSHNGFVSLQIWNPYDELCKMKPFWPRRHHQWRHSVTLNIAYYIHFSEGNTGNNANIVIILLGDT